MQPDGLAVEFGCVFQLMGLPRLICALGDIIEAGRGLGLRFCLG